MANTHEHPEHAEHHASDLAAEVGLVLCSIALLTKKCAFWFSGVAAAVLAIVRTASAYTITQERDNVHESRGHSAPEDKGKPH